MEGEKHTPGPWLCERVKEGHQIRMGSALLNPDDHLTRDYVFFDHECDPVDNPECFVIAEANARLIAAAPDLLAACHAALAPLRRLGDFIGDADIPGVVGIGPFDRCAIIDQINFAIAKAEGGS